MPEKNQNNFMKVFSLVGTISASAERESGIMSTADINIGKKAKTLRDNHKRRQMKH